MTTPTPHRSIFTGRMLFLTRNRKCQRRSIANEAGMCLENLTPNATPSSQKGREDKKKIRQVLSQVELRKVFHRQDPNAGNSRAAKIPQKTTRTTIRRRG